MNKKKVLMIVLFILFWIGVGTSIFWLLRKSKNVLPSLTYGVVERNNYKYDDIMPTNKGFEYYLNDKVGFIRVDGTMVIKPEYEELSFSSDNILAFINEGYTYVFDMSGNLILKTKDAVYPIKNVNGNDYFGIADDNNSVIYDNEGNKVYSGIDDIDFFI